MSDFFKPVVSSLELPRVCFDDDDDEDGEESVSDGEGSPYFFLYISVVESEYKYDE
jgi:hypothetical protein